jgi:16S rRNA (cytosine1402-N4)-methyltransferase
MSFHSLEDRMVKQCLNGHAAGCICPPGLPQCVCGHEPTMRVLTRRPVMPRLREIELNPRSKPAKLRAAVKL